MYLQKETDEKDNLRYKRNVYLLKLSLTICMGIVFYIVGSIVQASFDPREWHQFVQDFVLITTIVVGVIITVLD